MAEESRAGHFEDAADVSRLIAIEEEIGLGGVGVSGDGPGEEAESDEGIEEIAGGTGMETEAHGEGLEFLRAMRELGEDAHFDSAEQGSGGPEGEASLEDMLGGEGRLCGHGALVSLNQRVEKRSDCGHNCGCGNDPGCA